MGGAVGTFQKDYDLIIRGEGEGPVMMQAFDKRKKTQGPWRARSHQ